MHARKCCLHCPGTWSSSRREEHTCNVPTYVRGNLKLSSLKKHEVGEAERSERLRGHPVKAPPTRQNSCSERFAIAKRLHAENLQHQPLPDRVDDSVFKLRRPRDDNGSNIVDIDENRPDERRQIMRNRHKARADLQYVPVLGCKTPTTNMDLAICWEAPMDRCYEPSWPTHIDGSNGGPAPAIFTLVQHENEQGKAFKSPMERFEAKFSNIKTRCGLGGCRVSPEIKQSCSASQGCLYSPEKVDVPEEEMERASSSNDICKNLDSMHITNNKLTKSVNNMKRQPVHLRNCSPCECRGERAKRPRSRSIHSAPVVYQGTKNAKRNGLPTKLTVPRPRTPYAKRNFCIDTLMPPFSIITGCRDADYPEHWRLTSVYQQSYKNPRK